MVLITILLSIEAIYFIIALLETDQQHKITPALLSLCVSCAPLLI
jgi:hypothetical protein